MKIGIGLIALLAASCGGIWSVQLYPPTEVPPGLVVGYGAEKLGNNPESSRQQAYLKAIDDLLSHGPVVVSKTVQDRTTVSGASFSRELEMKFKLHASRVVYPSFTKTGVQDGFVWVLVGTSPADVEQSRKEFLEWRRTKRQQAVELLEKAGNSDRSVFFGIRNGGNRLEMLQAVMSILEEIGASENPDALYYEVKAALDSERQRIMQVREAEDRVREWETTVSHLIQDGRLASAEQRLSLALSDGVPQSTVEQFRLHISSRRHQAASLMTTGDRLLSGGYLKQASQKYQDAYRLNKEDRQIAYRMGLMKQARDQQREMTIYSIVRLLGLFH